MRPIHLAQLDKTRPVLVLTRETVRPYLTNVTVAPITSTIRGLSTEVPVGTANGLDHDSVVSLDNIQTIPARHLGRQVGLLLIAQEEALSRAIRAAFDLDDL
jgi:mRNA interferase MazF